MTLKAFRFGVIAAEVPDLASLTELARRTEALGYDVLLAPDPLDGHDPLTVLSAAFAATTELHLGTFVLAASFRDPRALDWQAQTLHQLSGGRFELGLGTGRPDAEQRSIDLGREFGSPGQRLTQLAEAIAVQRKREDRPKLLVTGAGPRVLDLAARHADIISLALPPLTTAATAISLVDTIRQAAGERFDELELGLNLFGYGDKTVPWLRQTFGVDGSGLSAAGAVTVVPGSPAEAADVLRLRREEFGVSYVTINVEHLETFAPVVAELRGS